MPERKPPRPSGAKRKARLQRLVFRTLPLVAVLAMLLVSLLLVSGAQRDSSTDISLLEDHYFWVLAVTAVALLVLLWSIADRLFTLVRNVRTGVPGALLAARWVRNFLALSLPPALIVYFFSAWFLSSSIDSWFDVRVESALADSLELGQTFLDTRTLEVRNQLRNTAAELSILQENGELLRRALLGRVRSSGPLELSVLETDSTLVATANINALTALPDRPGDFALLQATERGEYAAAEPTPDGGLQIRVIQLMPPPYPGASARFLQAIYPLPAEITSLAGSVEQEYHRYQNVSYLRNSLKQSFLLILSLVLLLTVLLAILAALNAARRLVSPLSRLSSATREVAAGDYSRFVEAGKRDEIGFLVESFNEMTRALKAASQQAEKSRAELQAQGDYLETVLGNLSSGVLTLDAAGRIITANAACRQILGLPDESGGGLGGDAPERSSLNRLVTTAPFLGPFVESIEHQAARGKSEWQQEIRIERSSGPLVLLMRGSRLPIASLPDGETGHGQVVVFDDVTILNQAQREAAWAEVARRLAHEVRNPLTPIRLAAERLRMKLADKLDTADGALLNKASDTIVAQVEALRKLVDAFGDYAQEPALSRRALQLDELIADVVALYQQGDTALRFELDLCPGPAGLAADSGRLRQMLHNLIRNAKEAKPGQAVSVRIQTRVVQRASQPWLQLSVRDDGPGFPALVLDKPFEPYVTNKPRGSGLGLAICRKIVSEHDGEISLSNPLEGGAEVLILLPV
ncbi:MAG: ATP-binding protein [Xanthomonadales bacterium]|nr:ATP-binding protein [Xanthomonadales bacterium]